MATYSAKASEINPKWFVVDAAGKTLGRLAARIAHVLRGKHNPIYTPHMDTGDYVIVINSGKIEVTGRKREDKVYHRASGYMGGLKETTFSKLLGQHPTRPIEFAVERMLPRNPLGRKMFAKLKVYSGAEHPHAAQSPQPLEL